MSKAQIRPLTAEEEGQIRAAYRLAKNQKQQLGILADLYLIPRSKVAEICGVALPGTSPAPKANPEPAPTPPALPAHPAPETAPQQKPGRRTYDTAVRRQVLDAIFLDGLPLEKAAEKFAVNPYTASGWAIKAKREAGNPSTAPKKEEPMKKEKNETALQPENVETAAGSIHTDEEELLRLRHECSEQRVQLVTLNGENLRLAARAEEQAHRADRLAAENDRLKNTIVALVMRLVEE